MPRQKRDVAVAERFGQNLRRVRRREGFTQERLSELGGLHRTEVGRLERGERVPRVDTLIRLTDTMGVPVDEFLDGIHWVPTIPAPEQVGRFTFSGRPSPRRSESDPKRESEEGQAG
ncbi:MAG: helix-turn-helix transcriptional regulator [Actinobacteria bacterium]|nr:helix-turn-helix transcriptional regulator [Actinomycetota bacterium]